MSKSVIDRVQDFIGDAIDRVSSRKFLVLLVAIGLFLYSPTGFSGDNLTWVFGIFVFGNVVEKVGLGLKKGGE